MFNKINFWCSKRFVLQKFHHSPQSTEAPILEYAIPDLISQGVAMNSDDFSLSAVDDGQESAEIFEEQHTAGPDDDSEEDEIKTPEVEHFDDAIKLYLREIRKAKLLTADDEKELATRIAKGD